MIFLVYSIVSLFNCMVVLFPALCDIHCTSMARYNLFVLKVPLNNNKPNQTVEAPLWSLIVDGCADCRKCKIAAMRLFTFIQKKQNSLIT